MFVRYLKLVSISILIMSNISYSNGDRPNSQGLNTGNQEETRETTDSGLPVDSRERSFTDFLEHHSRIISIVTFEWLHRNSLLTPENAPELYAITLPDPCSGTSRKRPRDLQQKESKYNFRKSTRQKRQHRA